MMKRFIPMCLICLFFFSVLTADDGMWMPHQMKMLNLKEQGLQMDPNNLYKEDGTGLMSAVVYLGGGTGEFVSKEGLILTNHHVAFGAIQRASDIEHDYITDGFLAKVKEEEIQASGYIADVLLNYKEITDRIVSVLKPGMKSRQRYDTLDKIKKAIIQEEEAKGPDLRCRIASMYSGNNYYLFTFKRIKDIRLVYAPPRDLGNFGGDIDNWMWPRHTCDFSFLRAYVSKDNVGADYNRDNIPYNPKSVMPISLDGVQQGDLTFVMGYPGRTYRNYTLSEVLFDINRMKVSIETRKDLIAFYEKASEEGKAVEIKYADKIKGLNNGLKNYKGKLEGFEKAGLIEIKKKQEAKFMEWVRSDKKRKKKYDSILEMIADYMKEYTQSYNKEQNLKDLVSSYYGSTLLSQAHSIVRTVEEKQKPDMERELTYQERNLDRLKQQVKRAERSYDLDTDKSFLAHQLKKILSGYREKMPSSVHALELTEADVGPFVEEMFFKTKLADPEERLRLMDVTPDDLTALGDPLIDLTLKLEEELKEIREASKAADQEKSDLKKIYKAALLEKSAGRMAPDANSTIRFTYGTVEGYKPRDAVSYKPLTSLSGVIEKETGEYPFRVPGKLKQLSLARDFGAVLLSQHHQCNRRQFGFADHQRQRRAGGYYFRHDLRERYRRLLRDSRTATHHQCGYSVCFVCDGQVLQGRSSD